MSNFEPIQSVPHDEQVFLYRKDWEEKVLIGYYSSDLNCFVIGSSEISYFHSPTHWAKMEIPKLPIEVGSKVRPKFTIQFSDRSFHYEGETYTVNEDQLSYFQVNREDYDLIFDE